MREWILAAPVFLPFVCGGLLLTAWFRRGEQVRSRAVMGAVMAAVLANSLIIAWILYAHMGDRLVLFRLFGTLTVQFRPDPMGGVFAGLIAVLWPLATLYSLSYMEKDPRKTTFFAYYVMTYGVTAGIALAGNLVTLYFFYEMLTLVTFPLVLHPMTKAAARASRKYLYYSIGGAAFAFIGLIFVLNYSAAGNTEFVPGGILSPAAAAGSEGVLLLAYVLAFFGFGVKAALFPVHGWLPSAAVAPTPVTALLHAVAVVKSGAFAILRLTYYNYGTGFLKGTWAQWTVLAAALITIVFASTTAVREIHWKRRLAYSTVSNLSYILFGAAVMTPLGLAAALCHMVAHAFMKIASFFCAGAVMHQTGKTYVYELDGLGRKMPVTFGCLTVASLSLMGIPLFAGFISKWNLAQAGLQYAASFGGGGAGSVLPLAGVAVILYSALMTGIYMLTVLVRAYFPREAGAAAGGEIAGGTEDGRPVTDPDWRMLVPLVIFAAVILALGLHSAPLLELLGRIGGEAA